MTTKEKIFKRAHNTFIIESEAIHDLINNINDDFFNVVKKISSSKGRVIITGIGKSGVIGMKIVATMNSTGTPAIFMHAVDAIHGDLGVIQKNDIVICISKSGNSPEIKALIPYLKKEKNLLVGMSSNSSSFLAQNSDFNLFTPIKKESCPNNLAPTTSTIVQLAMGDALAMCLLDLNKFKVKDFAKFHPGGSIGKALFFKTKDLISIQNPPIVRPNDSVKKVINEISSKRLGATAVIDEKEIMGIITDGDIRRMLESFESLNNIFASDIMTKNPITINHDVLATDAIKIMKKKNINHLIVNEDSNFIGIINILDFLKEGFS